MMRASSLPIILSILAPSACTGEQVTIGRDNQLTEAGIDASAEHAAPEASALLDVSTEPEPDWSGAFGACGHVIEAVCEAKPDSPLGTRVLFDTATLGPGHSILESNGRFTWIDKHVGEVHDTLLVIKQDEGGDASSFETRTLQSSVPLQPVAADGATVLACNAAGCSLFVWDGQQSQVPRLAGDALPAETQPVAIAGSSYAVGQGVYRFEGGVWNTDIAPQAGMQWRAIDRDEVGNVVVVGEGGAVRLKKGSGPWEVVDAGLHARLISVSVSLGNVGASILIGAEDGTMTRIEGGLVRTCQVGVGVSSIWHRAAGHPGPAAAGASSDGRGFVFFLADKPGCFAPVPASGVLKTRVWTCGIVANLLYVTDTVLWGTDVCAVD